MKLSQRFTEILRTAYHLLMFGHQAKKTKPLLLRLSFKKVSLVKSSFYSREQSINMLCFYSIFTFNLVNFQLPCSSLTWLGIGIKHYLTSFKVHSNYHHMYHTSLQRWIKPNTVFFGFPIFMRCPIILIVQYLRNITLQLIDDVGDQEVECLKVFAVSSS